MYFILWRYKEQKTWMIWDTSPYTSYDTACVVAADCFKSDRSANEHDTVYIITHAVKEIV